MEGSHDPCAGVDEQQLELVVSLLTKALREPGATLDAKLQEVATITQSQSVAECAKVRLRQRAEQIRDLRRGGWIEALGLDSWYQGPQAGDRHWPALRELLIRDGWQESELASLDHASTGVAARLGAPYAAGFNRRGLVLGYVQSGKTTNFTAVVAKAADAGYRLVVVLSGMHEGLRQQTQARLDRQLVEPHPEKWYRGTEIETDFIGDKNSNMLLGGGGQHRVLCVIKKNGSRLRRFLEWLGNAQQSVLLGCPALIIDDEADQAGVNAARADNAPTTINGLIREILSALPKVSYVGYTATPFANMLIDPAVEADLYPRDFILSLSRPPGHFGPESVFGREPLSRDSAGDDPDPEGLDMVRTVPEEELASLTPVSSDLSLFEPLLTPSLIEAIRYFWLSTAARRIRDLGNRHSTMLVHTSMRVLVHQQFRQLLVQEAVRTAKRLQDDDQQLVEELAALWQRESARVGPEPWELRPVDFNELRSELCDVVGRTEVVVDNSMSDDRLDYDTPEPQTVIAVGGNTLSRGLTLEGLCVSFFVRSARAYDTLLQMGRWFGYRRGYEDLPRIWMTPELQEWFRHLATVEQELRYDIERFEIEGLTPLQFGPRLRTHPALAITAASKMRAAVPAKVSYSGRRLQTILFNHRDAGWLRANIDAVRELIAGADAWTEPRQRSGAPGDWLLRQVDSSVILNFLGSYRFHGEARDLDSDLLRGYIRSQLANGELTSWTVAVLGLPEPRPGLGDLDIGLPERVNLINRSRVRLDRPYANIKSLMSKEDRAVDLPVTPEEMGGMTNGELQRIRNSPEHDGRGDGSGLLVIYPVSGRSEAKEGSRSRQNLDAVDDVMGVGIVFPEAKSSEGEQSYMTVDLRDQVIEEPAPEDEPDEGIEPEEALA